MENLDDILENMENPDDIFEREVKRWFLEKGDVYKRLDYPILNENSLVIDLGGYIGGFTESIYSRYSCNVLVFEPVVEFYNICNYKFKYNGKIKVYNFGLGGKSRECSISRFHDSSTEFIKPEFEENSEIVLLKSIKEFVVDNNIDCIDLLKINIEGGEYELLEYLINDLDLSKIIKNIQVQYHLFIPNHIQRRNYINSKLEETHNRTWNYDWVWENWEIKK
jgi:FkbM family methyltransferase